MSEPATRVCSRCGVRKAARHFTWHDKAHTRRASSCKLCAAEVNRLWRARQSPERLEAMRAASRARSAERYERIKRDPEAYAELRAYGNATQRKYYAARDPEAARAAARARYRRIKEQDPEQYARRRADQRMYQRLSLERAGQPQPPSRRKSINPKAEVGNGGHGPGFDPAPLVAFVVNNGGAGAVAHGNAALARSLVRILSGEFKTVTLATVDAVCAAHDLLMHDIYDPSQYPEVYAA
jgi:hypothetical protein